MRKFAFLLAIVALFAMSAAAFASTAAVPAIGEPANRTNDSETSIIGQIGGSAAAGYTSSFYYIKGLDKKDDLIIVVSADDDKTSTEKISADWTLLSADTEPGTLAPTPTGIGETSNGFVDVKFAYKAVSLDQLPASIALNNMHFNDADDAPANKGVNLVITPVQVAIEEAPITGREFVEDELDPDHKYPIRLTLKDVDDAWIKLPVKNVTISADADYGKLVALVPSEDCMLALSFDAAATVGTYSFTIKANEAISIATEIVISDDEYDDIQIAGLAKGDILGTVEFNVVPNTAKRTAISTDAAIKSLPATGAINSTQLNRGGGNFAIITPAGEILMLNDNVASSDVNYLGTSGDRTPTNITVFVLDASGYVNMSASGAVSADVASSGRSANYDVELLEYGTAQFEVIPASVVAKLTPTSNSNQSVSAAGVGAQAAVGEGINASAYQVEMKFSSNPAYTFKPDTFKFTLGDKGGYHSSSSSCSMGFGLAAVAGLAALALRKRSK